MTHTVFIDGAAGTTGLEIAERLAGRPEFELIRLSEDERKREDSRRHALNFADFAILCLPDEAAVEAMTLLDRDAGTRVIDASSAHRVSSGWIYGFPELVGPQVIAGAARVSNPGCYPTGFLALVAPLVRARLLPRDWPYSVNAVSGYSGGGKALIERFESDPDIAWRGYGLQFGHKHLPEMQQQAGLEHPPLFAPAVVSAHRGMVVEVPIPLAVMRTSADAAALRAELTRFYAGSAVVKVAEEQPAELLLRRSAAPSDALTLYVFSDSSGTQVRLVAVLDNLGKGASGAAVQSLNLMAGHSQTAGLSL